MRELLSPWWATVVLGVGTCFGLLAWPGQSAEAMALPAFSVLSLTVIVGIIWRSRVGAARRRNAALEAYANREIARARSGKAVEVGRLAGPNAKSR